MRVVVNALPLLSPLTGIGRYTYEVSKRFSFKPTYYYGFFSKELTTKPINKEAINRFPFIKKIARKLLKLRSKEFDVYFEPNFIPLSNIKAKKIVTTVHDFSFMNEEWHPKERVEYFKNNFWESIKRSDEIIVDSFFIKDEVKKYLNRDAKVVYLGVGENFKRYENLDEFRKKLNLRNFILFVGSIEPRKNLISLIKAYDRLDEKLKREFNLVLVGFSGWKNKEVMELIEKNRAYIKYMGYVSEKELAYLYNLTTLFVFPSFYEGFGLPPLEAMACGAPVMASNVASLPEVCGDAAVYIDPKSVDDMYEKLKYILNSESKREELSKKGLIQASKFSWDKCAREIEEILGV